MFKINHVKYKEHSLTGKIGSFKLQFLSSNLSALGLGLGLGLGFKNHQKIYKILTFINF
jgi:hypothetical protein